VTQATTQSGVIPLATGRGNRGLAQLTGPAAAVLIGQLHADGIVLTYDPDDRTLRAGDQDAPSVTIG
jgi:hypothetical protein